MFQKLMVRILFFLLFTYTSSSWATCIQGFVSGLYFVSNCSPEVLLRIAESIPNEEARERFRQSVRQSYQSGDSVSADVYFSVSPFVSQVGASVARSEVYQECDDGSYCAQRTVYYITEYQTLPSSKTFEQEFGFRPQSNRLNGSIYSMDAQILNAGLSSGLARSGMVAVQLIQSGALEDLGETYKAHWKVLMHGVGSDMVAEQSLAAVRAEAKALLSIAQSEIQARSEQYLAAGEKLQQDFELLRVRTESINKDFLDTLRNMSVVIPERQDIQSIETQIKELSKASLAAYKDSENKLSELQLGLLPQETIEGHRQRLQEAAQIRSDPRALTQQIAALQRLARSDKNVYRQEQYKNLLSAYLDEQGLLAQAMNSSERRIIGAVEARLDTPLGQALRDIYNEVLGERGRSLSPESYIRMLEILKASDEAFARGDRSTGNLLLNRVRSYLDYQRQDSRVATYRAIKPSSAAAQLFPSLNSPAQSFGEFQALQFANQLAEQPEIMNREQSLGQEIIDDIVAAEQAGDINRLMGRVQAGQIFIGVKSTMPKLRELQARATTTSPRQIQSAEKSMQLLNTAFAKIASKEDGAAQIYYELGMALADFALGLAPGVGWAKDVYEATFGVNLVTGEQLSGFEWSMAVVGVFTAGYGSKLGLLAKAAVFTDIVKAGKTGERAGEAAKAVKITEDVLDSAKNIRSQMSNLGEVIPGTTIPKYFRLKTEGAEFFVNPNATKHMGEYINSLPATHGGPLRNDLILASFEGSVKDAVKAGTWKTSLETGTPIMSGGWELIFSQRPTDELPVVIHALMKR